jgi:GT2 family glycosyltransferase
LWESVSGFSEEYDPGDGSDPDLVLKLWNKGVRYFKCLEGFRVYHFGSTTTRKRSELKLNKGTNTFIKKWGISPYILRRFYLRTGEKFKIHAKIKKDIFYFFTLLKVKIKRLFIT